MADVNVSNSTPYNGSLKYTVTATDESDGYVKFVYPVTDYLVANVQVLDFANGTIADDGMLIDDFSAVGEVKVGNKDAVAEVINLTIEGTVATTGTADVVIRGASAVNAVTTDGDDAETVATTIAGETFTGWTVTSSGNVVTFTNDTPGANAGANTFGLTTSTGITGTFEIITQGSDAGAFTLTEGQKLKVFVERDNAQFDLA